MLERATSLLGTRKKEPDEVKTRSVTPLGKRSLGHVIPAYATKKLGITDDDDVEIEIYDDHMVVTVAEREDDVS